MRGTSSPLPLARGAGAKRRGGPTPRPTQRAQQLRKTATISEKRLWLALKGRQLAGAKFSRQMPIGPYIADFLCREHHLVIEIDGRSHELTHDRDAARTRYLQQAGYQVFRFTNEEVRLNLDGVIAAIQIAITPTPLASQAAPPASGRGDK